MADVTFQLLLKTIGSARMRQEPAKLRSLWWRLRRYEREPSHPQSTRGVRSHRVRTMRPGTKQITTI